MSNELVGDEAKDFMSALEQYAANERLRLSPMPNWRDDPTYDLKGKKNASQKSRT